MYTSQVSFMQTIVNKWDEMITLSDYLLTIAGCGKLGDWYVNIITLKCEIMWRRLDTSFSENLVKFLSVWAEVSCDPDWTELLTGTPLTFNPGLLTYL